MLGKKLILLPFLIVFITTAITYAAVPVRIVLLPPIHRQNYNEPELNHFAFYKLKENLLKNNYDLALDIQVQNAVNKFTHGHPLEALPEKKILRGLSKELSSDLVFALEFTELNSMIISSLRNEEIEYKNVALTLAIYNAQDDSYVIYKVHKDEYSEFEGVNGIRRLVENCLDHINKKVSVYLKSIIAK